MITPDERVNVDLYISEDSRRLEVLTALELENRKELGEIARALGFLKDETKNAIADVEAIGLTDTKEELSKGRLTYYTRLSPRGVRFLKEKGLMAEEPEPKSEPETEAEKAEGTEAAE